jgi:exodeoxyribonuclease V alpha subunit
MSNMNSKVQELLAKAKAANAAKLSAAQASQVAQVSTQVQPASQQLSPLEKAKALIAARQASKQDPELHSQLPTILDRYGNTITLNAKQAEYARLASAGASCVLIGAAGTGKTTSMKAAIAALVQKGIGLLESNGHKKLTQSGTPAIVGCAYTRIAVANLKANMPEDMKANCLTIHALLEYQPFFEDYVDENGNIRTKKYFAPARHANNPLDSSIRTIIIDESSMLDLELFKKLLDAIQHPIQFIFLGDINQLPPVFGSAILGFAMNALPVVELTEVYRNAGPIVSLAHRILSGKPVPASELDTLAIPGIIKIQPWKKKLMAEDAVILASRFCINAIDAGLLDPEQDMILCPYNKGFGTIALNEAIAGHISKAKGEPTYEIRAGFKLVYLAVGDRVLYEKEPATIVSIVPNMVYRGAPVQPPSVYLNRHGILEGASSKQATTEEDLDSWLDSVVAGTGEDTEAELAKKASSHVVTVRLADGTEESLDTAGAINNLLLGYALTVHKAQGSEWRRVLLLTHSSHNSMITRELLYTAVTRAKESIHIIGEPDILERGITKQVIVGNTLAAKAEYFKGKAGSMSIEELRWN